MSLFGILVVVALPVAVWLGLRMRGGNGALLLVAVAIGIPALWAPQVQPDYSEPLHLITRLTLVAGFAMILGALLMLAPRPRTGP